MMKFIALFALVFAAPTGANAADFHGQPCTKDCSGHQAGYDWAEKHDIEDPDDCGGNSNSFTEGCRSRAEEQQESAPDSGDPDAEPTEE